MISKIARVMTILAAVLVALPAAAEDRGTADEAVALVKKAVAQIKSVGKEKAFASFSDPAGGFQSKDLYVFVQDLKGMTLVHKNPGLVGKDITVLKDADGNAFGATMTKLANEKGSGWVDYKWVNGMTKKVEPKSSYIERVDDVYVGAGIYK